MNNIFLRASDISQILKISKGLTYRLIAEGKIPSVRFGRVVRVKQEDLERFIARSQSDGAGADAFGSQKWNGENHARQ